MTPSPAAAPPRQDARDEASPAHRGGLAACLGIIAAFVLAVHLLAPVQGGFWWSDAPRHGLNGIFLAEFLRATPFGDPRGFAYDFYAQYPALTILFYPPLFYGLSAPAFLLFGESHAVAQAMVSLHMLVLGAGTFALARFWLGRCFALAAALLLLGLPEILLWGRQVMLEIPALAWLVWCAVFTLRHARGGGTGSLVLAALFALAALYTKISMAFVLPVLAAHLLWARGPGMLAERRVWLVLGLAGIGLVPLVVLTLQFGQANVQSVAGIADTAASRATLAGWVWYAARLPEMAGPIPLALAAIGAGAAVLRPAGAPARAEQAVLLGWFVLAYVALSFVELKEARHGVILLVPVAVWAALGLRAVAGLLPAAARAPAGVAVAAVLAAATAVLTPVPTVDGYRDAARIAAEAAPRGSVVLFSGQRDGSFIFNMRTETGRDDLTTVRADKILLSVAVRRELGVRETSYTDGQIRDLLRDLGVSVVVAQRDFWTDLGQMAALQRVLDGPDFEEIRRIGTVANVPVEDREIRIYRARWEPSAVRRELIIDLPIIGRRIQGRIGGE